MATRYWDNWDKGDVAETIESYWRTDANESRHRRHLASLAAPYLTTPGLTVLEVGCGSGLIYDLLSRTFAPNVGYVGVDTSSKMLQIARRNFPNGTFIEGDAYDLAFEEAAFDVVLCFEVLGHVPRIEMIVPQLLRVARKVCIMTVWRSPTLPVIDRTEFVGGYQFLHREYSDGYMRRIISEAKTPVANLRVVALSTKVRAYVVTPDRGPAFDFDSS